MWGAPAIPEETEALLRHDTDAYAAAEPVLDSVVEVFTVSSSPNYFLMVHSRYASCRSISSIVFDFY